MTGCTGSGPGWAFFGGGDKYDVKDFRKGVKELDISFQKNAPPDEVYEEESLNINLELKNNGAYEITDGVAKVTTIGDLISLDESPKNFQLEGRSNVNPNGEKEVLQLSASVGDLDKLMPGTSEHDVPVVARSCYLYQTKADMEVCIDTHPENEEGKACNVEDQTSSGQGAPVAVTKLETEMIPSGNQIKPSFKIKIDNKGDGTVLHPNYYDATCTGGAGEDIFETVFVNARLDNYNLDCKPSQIKLSEDAEVTCSTTMPTNQPTYKTHLQITLDYGYMNSLKKTITVKAKP